MEGFVFDLQRFANEWKNWPVFLNNLSNGQDAIYDTNYDGTYSIQSNTAVAIGNQAAQILVHGTGADSCTICVNHYNYGANSSTQNPTDRISLTFPSITLTKTINITINQDYVTMINVPGNASIELPSGVQINDSTILNGATVKKNGTPIIGGAGSGGTFSYTGVLCVLKGGAFTLYPDILYDLRSGSSASAVTVGGNGTIITDYSHPAVTISSGNIKIQEAGLENTTISTNFNVKNGAAISTYSGKSYTSCSDNSSVTVTNTNNNPAGETVTLTAGVFAATDDEYALNNNIGVKYNDVVYTSQKDGSTSKLVNDVLNLTSGKFISDGASTFTVGSATSTTYTTKEASAVIVSGNQALFYGGGMTLSGGKSITVSDGDGTKKSTILAGSGSSIDVSVNNGTYTISNLANGDSVSIDGRTYSYTVTDGVGKLLYNGIGWQKSNVGDSASITFSIAGGTGSFTDTLSDNSWSTCAPNLANKDDLKTLIDNLTGTLYFDASGNQLPEDATSGAYTLTKDGQGNYTLTSTADSTTNLDIDLTEVDDDKLSKLTINLAAGTTGAQQVKLKAGASLKGLTLGAGDSVLASDGTTVLAKAGTASGTVTVANGTVTALTGGSFVGVGEHNIEATTSVTIDGVTFVAGAKGTFTNGAEAAADTFAVTAGTASIDSNFQGTTVTAHEVAYTVVSPTVATFSGTTNEVTNFTSGKITFTAADNPPSPYTIGNQTISDGNGATLTFVAANTNTYLCSTGEGTISLSAGKSITVSDANGTNTKQIAAGDGSTIDVAVTNGKYTLSGLDTEGEKVSIGGKNYLYHKDTNFLEEYADAEYQTGTGTGYILKGNSSSISFTCDGVAGPGELDTDTDTAMAMPTVLYGAGVLGTICRAMPAGATYYFGADGERTDEQSAAYTLTKSADGYTLTSNANANSDLNFVDASGLTNLKVDFSAEGDGAQTLKVDSTTTLSSDSKLGAGDKLTYGTNTLLTANAATTLSMAAGPDISVASGANVTVPTSPTSTGIKTAGNGNYTVNGISVTTSGDAVPFIIIIPDAENATTLTLDNMAAGESFTANIDGKNYTIGVGGQTFKNVSAGVEINGAGTATLTGDQSVTVGTNTVIQPISGNGVQVTLTGGKYTLSGLKDGDEVSLGGKTYRYRANTKFLEEYNGTYSEGSGDGFILNSDGSITFNSDGTLDTATASAMPTSLKGDDALGIICHAVAVGSTYTFKADGTRADTEDETAYTLTKTADGYTLASTDKATKNINFDASGITGLTVDFSAGTGTQTLKVNDTTTLSSGSKLGAGDTITDGNNAILVKASGDGGTVTVEGGKVTLNSGTFEGTGTNATPISATAPVTIDGVTFAAGAEGTFTNGTPDTFEVSKGKATIDKTFNGTEVRTKGVTYTVAPPTEATFDGATNEVTDFKSGKLTFTATDDKSYAIGGQTVNDGNGEVLTFIAKENKTYLCGTTNNHGGISLKPGESITVTDENGNNPTTIAPLENSTVNVSVTSGGKYTLSGLDDGEEVSIENKTSGEKKTYLYRKDTQFLEEFNETYPDGSGDGFILKEGSISFNNDGTLDEGTATSMPSSLAEKGALDIINRAMPEGNTYYFNEKGGRAESDKTAAYTLEKTSEKSVLKSTENCTGTTPIDIDARGLKNLTVDFSEGEGKQTLTVNKETELVEGSVLGAGDIITYDDGEKKGTYITCGPVGTTSIFLTPGQPLTISDLTPGTTVDVAPGMEVNAGNAVYKAADKGTPLTIGKSTDGTGTIGVQSGTLVPTAGTAYTMLDSNGQKGDVVTVTGKAEITTDATGKAAVTGLDKVGEKVVIKNSEGQETTYEVIAENLIKKVDSEGNITHWTVTDSSKLTLTDEEGTTQGVDFKAALVATKDKTAEGETYLTANGVSTEAGKDDVAAVLTKDGSNKTLEVSKDMELSVQLTDDTLTVKDKGTNTTYNLTDKTEISASGATFTTAEGVVSDVTGTLTVKEGELDTKDGSDKAKYALSEGTKVNFQPGSPLSGTTVTTAKGNTIVIKESDNTNTTTVDSQGNLTGVDGNAEITGLPVGATVTTTGSGTLALNGKTWEVKGDSDGATFTVSSDGISGVTGLAEGATLSTADRVSDLTINGCTITRAKNGLSYTAGSAGKGEFGLSHQGDSLRTADGNAFTVDKSQNGVSVGTDGKITGLTDGEKVTVTTEDGTKLVYEVTGNTLVTTKTAPDGTITTMTSILAEGETGFAIEPGAMKAANGSTDASQILANADINAGSTEISPVNTVTNGMLLDKKGHATADSDKAIAEITIKDDGVLKYEATKEVRQTIKIGTGSTAEWDITTTNKADTIDYAGSHDVSITSRDGNDKITISGTGDAVVRGESGRNTIIHTGTGDATLQGGTGNDTITSTHADDVITCGEGKDTFILTNVESHVTDFTYGQDKAIITSSAGALDPYKVKVTTDGNISYTGAGAVSGSLNVDGQGYGDFYAATLADVDGHNKLNVGWTGAQGGMIDASSLTDKLLLIGNSEGSSDSLIGGQSRDTIIAGTGESSLWGGAGRDLIESNDEASHTIFFLAGDGNDTVTGFTAYGEDNADTLNFLGQGVTSVKHTDKGIQLYHGSDKMTLTGNYDANTMIQWENGDDHGIAKIGKTGEDNKFTYNEEVTSYLGSSGKDTITIGDDVDTAEIWLDGSHGANYDSVEILDASSSNGTVILAGGESKQTITGGKGNSSLWGGTGSATDVLNGGSGEDVFYYGKEEGNDIVNNASADDKVMLYNLSLGDLKAADIDTNKVTITQQNGQTLTINGRAGEFTLSDGSTWAADYSTKTWNRVK